MVEGSQIDWASHYGSIEQTLTEMVEFDDAVGAGLDFAQENEDTLVLVLADHETAGLFILDGSIEEKKVTMSVTASKNHTANMVPLFAYGPGSSVFSGIHPIKFVGETLMKYTLGKNGDIE